MVVAKQQCRYSIIRFMPHVETGEFANIGIILTVPKSGYIDFRIETRRYARITTFFDTLEPDYFRNATAALARELRRICWPFREERKTAWEMDFPLREDTGAIFTEITREREGLINFGPDRVMLAENPKEALDRLFGYYVERNFVTQRYRETVLEERMRGWFQDFERRFVKHQFDDGLYRASFPFVELDTDGAALKVLKPFFLGQREPTAIIDHGVKWTTSVVRLRRAGLLPDRVLFAVEGPSEDDDQAASKLAAYEETMQSLRENDIDVLPFEKQDEILNYASRP